MGGGIERPRRVGVLGVEAVRQQPCLKGARDLGFRAFVVGRGMAVHLAVSELVFVLVMLTGCRKEVRHRGRVGPRDDVLVRSDT